MSRSQKWKQEWAFFLDEDGRRKYAELCRHCTNECKQSFRAKVIACPYYTSKRAEGSDLLSE
ncbi:MAG: hypothetical protein EUB_02236 [Eubacterium sp.]|uniref:hypothetical protein n=1 Tax=Eubacterium sp. TaxID=142586 RepID=UPI00303913A1